VSILNKPNKLKELKKYFQENLKKEITLFYGNEGNQFSFSGTIEAIKEKKGYTFVSIKRTSGVTTELILEGQWDAILKVMSDDGKIIYQK